jgi:hypothetical protein
LKRMRSEGSTVDFLVQNMPETLFRTLVEFVSDAVPVLSTY